MTLLFVFCLQDKQRGATWAPLARCFKYVIPGLRPSVIIFGSGPSSSLRNQGLYA